MAEDPRVRELRKPIHEATRPLFIHITTTLERYTGCGNIAGINEPTVKDAATGQIVRCQECTRGRVLQ